MIMMMIIIIIIVVMVYCGERGEVEIEGGKERIGMRTD